MTLYLLECTREQLTAKCQHENDSLLQILYHNILQGKGVAELLVPRMDSERSAGQPLESGLLIALNITLTNYLKRF